MATDKNTKMAFVIPAEGTPYCVSYNRKKELEVVQRLVGGYIEALPKTGHWTQPERGFNRIAKKGKVYICDDRSGKVENPHSYVEEIVFPSGGGMFTVADLNRLPRRNRPVYGAIVIVMTNLQADRLRADEEVATQFPYEDTYFP
jgi:hypothetical protein